MTTNTQSEHLPRYVLDRLRRPVPENCSVVPGSTPVLCFGNPHARVATLGLNPSRAEFLGRDGAELSGHERRFEMLASLGLPSLTDAPISALLRVHRACAEYFAGPNPYRGWFGQLEAVLKRLEVSYDNGSACHLDLVQWATDPTWRHLPRPIREMLILEDMPFLLTQLTEQKPELLLLNGHAVVRAFTRRSGVRLMYRPERILGRTTLSVGRGPAGMLVIGWSTNLQSAFGVSTALRRAIADAVVATANENRWNSPG